MQRHLSGFTSNSLPVTPAGFGAPSSMDVARPTHHARNRRRWRWALLIVGLLITASATLVLSRLRPAAPSVDRSSVWIDTVRRGPMIREVRGLGTLVPESIRWIAARNDARVEQIVVFPGAQGRERYRPAHSQQPGVAAVRAGFRRRRDHRPGQAGQSCGRSCKARPSKDKSAFAKAQGDRDTAMAAVEVNERLSKEGLIATVELKKSQISAKELTACCEIERQRVDFTQSIRRTPTCRCPERTGPGESASRVASRPTGCLARPRRHDRACSNRFPSRSGSASPPAPIWPVWRTPRA